MIEGRELLEFANKVNLRAGVVEKDYVLGWLLTGINRDPELSPAWVFKGGTCLKKCYFETYRFSEDLDFTITEERHFNADFLRERFRSIGEWLRDETGIELPPDLMRFDIYPNSRNVLTGEGRVAYRGPIAPRGGDLPRIKLDLTLDEKLVLPSVMRPIAHAYSDRAEDVMQARAYAYPEVFGEKVRALGERARPRDLYDVIHLFRHTEFQAAPAVIRDVVTQKCAHKSVPFPTLEALQRFKDELAADWKSMLAHQLPELPQLETFWNALPEFFRWLTGDVERPRVTPYRIAAGEVVLRGPVGGLPIPFQASAPIEVIRFAASNLLCVDLDYVDEKGNRSRRIIEPYSLRRTSSGDIVLGAYNIARNDWRSYRLDRIKGAQVANQTFTPRYEVELTPTGILSAPPVQRSTHDNSIRTSARSRSGARKSKPISRPHKTSAGWSTGGIAYVYRCPLCGKTFRRKTMDAHLNPHKAKNGWPCSGRTGIYEGTR